MSIEEDMAVNRRKCFVLLAACLFGPVLLAWRNQLGIFKVTSRSTSVSDDVSTLPTVTVVQHRQNSTRQNGSMKNTFRQNTSRQNDSGSTPIQLFNMTTILPQTVEYFAELCMRAAHMDLVDASLLIQARINARYLYDEFKQVIPHDSLSHIRSHCWKESFFIQWSNFRYSGQIGDVSFKKELKDYRRFKGLYIPQLPANLARIIGGRTEYMSDTVCLPNIFLVGFGKCGSSFYYCFINKLLSLAGVGANAATLPQYNVVKEPHFWLTINARDVPHVPKLDDLGYYFLNFLPGMKLLTRDRNPAGELIDSTPNVVFDWPRFRNTEHDLTNYCILPSVVPVLLPNSKYTVIVRNPITMLYSDFWFSCTGMGFVLSATQKLKGPDLFHERIVTKMDMFNDCMKDTSTPSISSACKLEDKHSYASCIQQRLHLLDKCIHEISFDMSSPDFPKCGKSRLDKALFYVHIRKWLSVVPRNRLHVVTLEELTRDPKKVAYNLLTFLNLDTNMAPGDIGSITCHKNTQVKVDYRHDPRLQMRNDTLMLLEHFYFPFNSMLAELVGIDLMTLW